MFLFVHSRQIQASNSLSLSFIWSSGEFSDLSEGMVCVPLQTGFLSFFYIENLSIVALFSYKLTMKKMNPSDIHIGPDRRWSAVFKISTVETTKKHRIFVLSWKFVFGMTYGKVPFKCLLCLWKYLFEEWIKSAIRRGFKMVLSKYLSFLCFALRYLFNGFVVLVPPSLFFSRLTQFWVVVC